MEYAISAHWTLQLLAFFMLMSVFVMQAATGSVNIFKRLVRRVVPYIVSAAPMALMIFLLYVVSCRL